MLIGRTLAPRCHVRNRDLQGLQLDDGAVAAAPDLLPKRAVFFGDSITEGVNAECHNPAQGTGSLTCSTPGDLCGNP